MKTSTPGDSTLVFPRPVAGQAATSSSTTVAARLVLAAVIALLVAVAWVWKQQHDATQAARAAAEREAARQSELALRHEEQTRRAFERQLVLAASDLKFELDGLDQALTELDRSLDEAKTAERDLAARGGLELAYVQRRRALLESFRSEMALFIAKHPARKHLTAAQQLLANKDLEGAASEFRLANVEWKQHATEPLSLRFTIVGKPLIDWLAGEKELSESVLLAVKSDEAVSLQRFVAELKQSLSYLDDTSTNPAASDWRGRMLPLRRLVGPHDADFLRWKPRFAGTPEQRAASLAKSADFVAFGQSLAGRPGQSGFPGLRGMDGRNGYEGTGATGYSGDFGGWGGSGEAGGQAGSWELVIAEVGFEETNPCAFVTARDTSSGQTKSFCWDPSKPAVLNLKGGDGGRGGNGGEGGNGGRGGTGTPGARHSLYANGQRGGTGGQGGNGGGGGSGGPGGWGGHATIRISGSPAFRTLARANLKVLVSGGAGGAGGQGGAAGRPGQGGAGGKGANFYDPANERYVDGREGESGTDGFSGYAGQLGFAGPFGLIGSVTILEDSREDLIGAGL